MQTASISSPSKSGYAVLAEKPARKFVWVAAIVVLHASLLFLVMPALNSFLGGSYGANQFPDGYDQLAQSLVDGHGYRFYSDTAPTLMREPGYPILLAGLMIAFGKSFVAVRMLNLLFALGTAWCTVRIAARVMPDEAKSHLLVLYGPALLFLFHPGVLMAENRGGAEIVFAFLLTLFMLLCLEAVERSHWWLYSICGLVLGATVLIRSTPMLFPVPLLAYMLLRKRDTNPLPGALRGVALLTISMLVVLSPWVVRNYGLTGKIIPTASVLGVSAQAGQFIGEHELEGKSYLLLDREASRERDHIALQLGFPFEDGQEGYYQTFYRTADEIQFSNYLLHQVVSKYERSPALFLRCVAQNIFNFWFVGKNWTVTALNAIIQLPYLAFACIGVTVLKRHRKMNDAAIPLAFVTYVMTLHILILAQARYSIPLMGLISVFATAGLLRFVQMKPVSLNEIAKEDGCAK